MPLPCSTLNASNLETLGTAKLAALLVEVSEGNAASTRPLRLALGEGQSADDAAREVRKLLKAIKRSDLFLHLAKPKKLLTELKGHLATISGSIRVEQPNLAHALHWELLELSEGLFDPCHDGN